MELSNTFVVENLSITSLDLPLNKVANIPIDVFNSKVMIAPGACGTSNCNGNASRPSSSSSFRTSSSSTRSTPPPLSSNAVSRWMNSNQDNVFNLTKTLLLNPNLWYFTSRSYTDKCTLYKFLIADNDNTDLHKLIIIYAFIRDKSNSSMVTNLLKNIVNASNLSGSIKNIDARLLLSNFFQSEILSDSQITSSADLKRISNMIATLILGKTQKLASANKNQRASKTTRYKNEILNYLHETVPANSVVAPGQDG